MQMPPNRIRIRKCHFQLLELMVAAFILLVCIAPTMRIFTSMYQSQQTIIRENQRDHLVHLIHARFTEQLYRRKIPLKEMMKGQPTVISLEDPELNELIRKSGYNLEGIFEIVDFEPKDREKTNKYLGKIEIKMTDRLYRSPKQNEHQKIENEDASAFFYDYYVYIDSGAKSRGEERENGNAIPSEIPARNGANDGDVSTQQNLPSPQSRRTKAKENSK